MLSQSSKAKHFHELHVSGSPVILFNMWDVGSANAIVQAGAKALATGSASVALANGYSDGEQIPLNLVLANVQRIVEAVDVPVSLDFEGAYAIKPDDVAENVGRAMATGIVGINFEDQVIGSSGLYSLDDQCERINAAWTSMGKSGVSGFLNARTDIFLKSKPEEHTAAMVAEAIRRADAYAQAGADGFFAAGLAQDAHIAEICKAVSLPVNIIALPYAPPQDRLIELGASRISYGPVPYRKMIQFVGDQAKALLHQDQ